RRGPRGGSPPRGCGPPGEPASGGASTSWNSAAPPGAWPTDPRARPRAGRQHRGAWAVQLRKLGRPGDGPGLGRWVGERGWEQLEHALFGPEQSAIPADPPVTVTATGGFRHTDPAPT